MFEFDMEFELFTRQQPLRELACAGCGAHSEAPSTALAAAAPASFAWPKND